MPSWRAGGSWPLSLFCLCWFCWDSSLRPRAPDTCLDTGPGPVSRGTATCATSDPTSFCFSPTTRTWNWVNACPPPDLLGLFVHLFILQALCSRPGRLQTLSVCIQQYQQGRVSLALPPGTRTTGPLKVTFSPCQLLHCWHEMRAASGSHCPCAKLWPSPFPLKSFSGVLGWSGCIMASVTSFVPL